MASPISIVIPTYQAAGSLGQTLRSLAAGTTADDETIVADGGSDDGTVEIAAEAGARVIIAPRGRGHQLAAGASAAVHDWLFFLHADSIPGTGWRTAAASHMADPVNAGRAGYFRLGLDDAAPAARRVERLALWRARVLGLPYGDQGLLVPRPLYIAVGGYRPLALMEDVDLVRRLGRDRLAALPVAVTTSAARYRRDGWWARPLRNVVCLGLYFAGVPARWIERVYR